MTLSQSPDSFDLPSSEVEPQPSSPRAAAPSVSTYVAQGLHILKTLPALRSIGYGLVFLSFVDLLYILFPLELTNPVWEYQIIGDLIRLVPVPILAFMLVFYGETTERRRMERPVLRVLSWSLLVIGVSLLLLIPLTVVNTMRISSYNNDQINIQIQQQKLQLDSTKSQLEKASMAQLESLIPVADEKTGKLPDAPKTPEAARKQVLSNIQKARETAEAQASQARKNVQQNLMKNSSKIIIEALIAGALFLYHWHLTKWARQRFAGAYEMVEEQGSLPMPQANASKSRRRRR
jgi:hypothetical protein